jgi:hypothetical protein
MYSMYVDYADKIAKQGKLLNPDITIDQTTIDRWKAQAKAELEPYYGQIYRLAEADLKKAGTDIQKGYEDKVRDIGQAFGKGLETAQESYAKRGLEFSSERQRAEQMLADEAQRKIDDAAKAAEESAYKVGTEAERTYGSRNLAGTEGWNINSGYSPILGKAGVYGLSGSSGTRDIFTGMSGITGSTERERTTAEGTRVNELEENERKYRANLYM